MSTLALQAGAVGACSFISAFELRVMVCKRYKIAVVGEVQPNKIGGGCSQSTGFDHDTLKKIQRHSWLQEWWQWSGGQLLENSSTACSHGGIWDHSYIRRPPPPSHRESLAGEEGKDRSPVEWNASVLADVVK